MKLDLSTENDGKNFIKRESFSIKILIEFSLHSNGNYNFATLIKNSAQKFH